MHPAPLRADLRLWQLLLCLDKTWYSCGSCVQVTAINLGGYLLAFGGVCWFNYTKLQNMKVSLSLQWGRLACQRMLHVIATARHHLWI